MNARRSRDQLRGIVLEAAADLLAQAGPGLGLENVTYARVFQHLEEHEGVRVTAASVHERIWQSQTDFQVDVMRHAAELRWLDQDNQLQALRDRVAQSAALRPEDRWQLFIAGLAELADGPALPGSVSGWSAHRAWFVWLRLFTSAALGAQGVDGGDGRAAGLLAELRADYQRALTSTAILFEEICRELGREPAALFGDGPTRWDDMAHAWATLVTALLGGLEIQEFLVPTELEALWLPLAGDSERMASPLAHGLIMVSEFVVADNSLPPPPR